VGNSVGHILRCSWEGGASLSTAAATIFPLTERYQTGAKAPHCFPVVGYHAVKSARE
jgi:hypothetical protein